MNLKSNIFIFSVFQKDEAQNQRDHLDLIKHLNRFNIPHKELLGYYKGDKESSILIEGFNHRDTVEYFCKKYGQECYLESHSDRSTYLVYPQKKEYIGKLVPVSREKASLLDSYSFDPILGQYYITEVS